MKSFWNFFLNNKNFSYIILFSLLAFGLLSLISIPKESAPEIIIPVAIVSTSYPGASAIDIEKLITNKIEDQLAGNLENLNDITSNSIDSFSSIVVEFGSNADIDKSIQEVKDEVDKVKSELPTDANDPIVTEVNFVDQPIMNISLIGSLSDIEWNNLVDSVETELKKVSGISKISNSGLPERQVQVVVSKESLSQFNISINEIVSAIRSANSSLPVGSLELGGIKYPITFEGSINDIESIKDLAILSSGGEPIYIRDIAEVYNGVSERTSLSRASINNNPSEKSISVSVFKKSGGDITKIASDLRNKLSDIDDNLLSDVEYLITFDNGEFVSNDLKNLSFSALQTIILVFVVLLITLGWREAVIAGLAIPLSFLVAFIGLNYSGNTINFISLFSLILSVGILVDSAIVITESIHTNMKKGGDKTEAARLTIKDFYYPLTSGTATTIAVFTPLFLLSGVTGQFISSIPFTIIFVLVASLFVALGFIPLIASLFLKRRSKTRFEQKQEEITHIIEKKYSNFLSKIIGNKKREKIFIRSIILLFIISMTLPFFGFVKVIFFPQENVDFLYIEVEEPQGTTLAKTDLAIRQVEDIIYEYEDVESFTTEVGATSAFSNSGGSSDSKFGNITIILKEDRELTSSEILKKLRKDLSTIDTTNVRAFEPNNGPSAGSPINIKFFSNDLDVIDSAVKQSEDILASIEGSTGINSSAKNDINEFRIIINRERASQLGISATEVASNLRTSIFGTEATTINDIDGDIDIFVKLNLNENSNLPDLTSNTTIDTIEKISFPTPSGPVLLGSLVETKIDVANSIISHEDQKRVGFVSSEIEGEKTAREIIKEFEVKFNNLDINGEVEVSFGGETENVNQTFKEMGLALILGIILILSILVLQFNSYRYAFYIVSIVPLSLIGVFFGLAITGKALSFPSIMGFIALSGIVVNNSIILIDVMNKLRRANPEKKIIDVVIEGATMRLRPILLTTVTTVIGVIPLTYVSEIWGPLAYSIMFGLTFAVVITLLLIPILYNRNPGKLD